MMSGDAEVKVATTCLSGLAGAMLCIPAQAETGHDPRIQEVFQAFCVDTFPAFAVTAAVLKRFDATGDDPISPARANRTGSNRTWNIGPVAGGAYNIMVQTYFGDVDGEAASGCLVTSSGKLDAGQLSGIKAALPGATIISRPKTKDAGVSRARFLVDLAGRQGVFTVVKRNDPPHDGIELSLEQVPASEIARRSD